MYCQKFYEKMKVVCVCEFVGVWVKGVQRGQAFQGVEGVPRGV